MTKAGVYYTHEPYEVAPQQVRVRTGNDGRPEYILHAATVQVFQSARQLMITVTGHPTGRNWPFARYFGVGKYASAFARASSVFDLFPKRLVQTEVVTVGPSGGPTVITPQRGLAVGIDLARRGDEVAKLLFAGFGNKIRSAKYDPDEVLQEVYKGLLIRNRGRGAWNPDRSSFGHYVHMVAGCVMSNYHRKQRRRAMESAGVGGWSEGAYGQVDVASGEAHLPASAYLGGDEALGLLAVGDVGEVLRSQKMTSDNILALRILSSVREGYTRGEIAERMKVPKASVSRALSIIRGAMRSGRV